MADRGCSRNRILYGAAVLAVAMLAAVRPPDAAAAEGSDGQALFLAQKCNTCHGVSSVGIEPTTKSEKMKGPDLAGVVAEKGEEWAGKYLRKEIDVDGKKHGKEVKLSPEEMTKLLTWLKEQKKPA